MKLKYVIARKKGLKCVRFYSAYDSAGLKFEFAIARRKMVVFLYYQYPGAEFPDCVGFDSRRQAIAMMKRLLKP